MREIRTSGSEGGGTEPNRFSLPLSKLTVAKATSTPTSVYRRMDRGRESRLGSVLPPSEPDVRISRIRLSSWWYHLQED